MENAARDLVNERLYCCRLQLDQYKQLNEAEQLPKLLVERFSGEAMVHHLVALYRCYLTELSLIYQGPEVALQSIVELDGLMREKGLQAAEINELVNLEGNPDSWLSKLLAASVVYYEASVASKPRGAAPSAAISSIQVSSEEKTISLNACTSAYSALTQLIESQRSLSEEW